MPTSQINPEIHFNTTEKVVFLVNIKNTLHAFLLIENENQQMERYDFSTTATPQGAILHVIAASSKQSFNSIPGTLYNSYEANAGLEGHVSINSASRDDFVSFAEKGELQYKFWVCSHAQGQTLRQRVCDDIANPPRYGLSGMEAKVGSRHHNCYTWSVEKLQQTGLNAALHWTAYLIAAKPNMIDKPTLCAIL